MAWLALAGVLVAVVGVHGWRVTAAEGRIAQEVEGGPVRVTATNGLLVTCGRYVPGTKAGPFREGRRFLEDNGSMFVEALPEKSPPLPYPWSHQVRYFDQGWNVCFRAKKGLFTIIDVVLLRII